MTQSVTGRRFKVAGAVDIGRNLKEIHPFARAGRIDRLVQESLMQKWTRSLGRSAAVALVLASAAGAYAQQSLADKSDLIVTAITQPSDRRQLSFEMRGLLREEAVKEGETVKKGQVLMAQDDRSDKAQLEALKLQANSLLEIEYAQKDVLVKQSVVKRYEAMSKDNVAAASEMEEKQLDLTRAETQVKLAKQEKEQKKFEAAAKGFQVENMTLVSPIDGIVERILNHKGETTNPEPDHPSIVVVQINPLWVVMYLPNKQADQIKADDTFAVRYDDKQEWKQAKVQFISPTAEAKSFKRLVRLEVPNEEMVASGHEVSVKLPERLAAAAPGVASAGK
jgi:RND family efflux transporter MFP subunit